MSTHAGVDEHNLNITTGATLFFKCENFQKVGAFKARGACNAVFSLSAAEAHHGVITHSSGNHGAALAYAAGLRGIPAIVVMPENAPAVKRAAVAGYGARIVTSGSNPLDRETMLEQTLAETGATFVHPSNDPRVIAGQGTAALEFLEEVPDLDIVITPVGAGGCWRGTALAVAGRGVVLARWPPSRRPWMTPTALSAMAASTRRRMRKPLPMGCAPSWAR
jgi:threonine dehydratase